MAKLEIRPLQADNDTAKTILNDAKQRPVFTLINGGRSPWLDGMTFKIIGYELVDVVVTETSETHSCWTFKTSIGVCLFLSMLTRIRLDANGEQHIPSGTFNKAFANALTSTTAKNVGDFLDSFTASVKNRNITVALERYNGLSRNGNVYPATLVNFNFVGDTDVASTSDSTNANTLPF